MKVSKGFQRNFPVSVASVFNELDKDLKAPEWTLEWLFQKLTELSQLLGFLRFLEKHQFAMVGDRKCAASSVYKAFPRTGH